MIKIFSRFLIANSAELIVAAGFVAGSANTAEAK